MTKQELDEKIALLKAAIDEGDRINALKSENHAVREALEREILEQLKDDDKMSHAGLTVYRKEKPRATYQPEKWDAIAAWAMETGNMHIIQRRLTDSRVEDLVQNGVPLPDGLAIEYVPELGTRRG